MNQPDTAASSLRLSRRAPKGTMPRLPIQRGGASQKKQRQKAEPQHRRTTDFEARLAAVGNKIPPLAGAIDGAIHSLDIAIDLLKVVKQHRLKAEAVEGTVEDGSVRSPNGGSLVPVADNATTAIPFDQDASAEADWEPSPPPSPKSSITLKHKNHTPQVSPGPHEESPHQSSVPVETTEPAEAVERMPRNGGSSGKYYTSPCQDAACILPPSFYTNHGRRCSPSLQLASLWNL